MYLKSIELYGFKSFAERAEIKFRDGIAGIVGPNGSGKSNITDAVRWVLGEQSAKVLRGSRMEDLIFSGTDRRKQLGMAEVSLTFDNKSGNLPIEYGEVVVKRRVYRSGESEYLINNNTCKLRDIKELFMDTGIGIDGYSIIGQGRIDSILSSKSEDRRKLFEEAAGIVKYKTRKENTGKKLERTNQNILRVEDILNELGMRIDPLKEESEKARAYDLFYGELKNLEISLFMEEIDRINERMKQNREKMEAVQQSIIGLETSRKEAKGELGLTEEKLLGLRNLVQADEKRLAETSEQKNQLNYEMELFTERKRTAEKEHSDRELVIKANRIEVQRLNASFESKIEEAADLSKREANLNDELEDCKRSIDSLTQEMTVARNRLESEKRRVLESFSKSSELKSKYASLDSYESSMSKRIEKVVNERNELDGHYADKTAEMDVLLRGLKSAEEIRDNALLTYESAKKSFEKESDSEMEMTGLMNELSRALKTLGEKRVLYGKLIENYEGFNSSVKNSLKALRGNVLMDSIEGTVSEVIEVEKAYEVAIETALGFSSQHIICDTVDSAKRIIDFVKREKTGRITLLPMNDVKKGSRSYPRLPNDNGIVGTAKELIRYDSRFENIIEFVLGNIVIVSDSQSAVRLIKDGFKGRRLITLEGDVFNPGGTITGGSIKGRSTGLLSRKRILEETENEIRIKSHELEKTNYNLQRIGGLKIAEEKAMTEAACLKADSEKEVERLSRQIEISRSHIEGLIEKRVSLAKEISELEEESGNLECEKSSIIERINAMEIKHSENENTIGELEKNEQAFSSRVAELKEDYSAKKVDLAILSEKEKAVENEISRMEDSIKSIEKNSSDQNELLKSLKSQIEGYGMEIDEKRKTYESLVNKIAECKKEVDSYRMSIEENVEMARRLQADMDKIESDISLEKERSHKLELSDTRNQINYDHFIKQLWEVYQISYVEAMDSRVKVENRSAVVKRIDTLKNEIDLLGDVNKAAVKEYEEVLRRHEFLEQQKNDLLEAKETLEDLIVKLEEKMVKIFKEEIKIINSNFNQTFNSLFNGGRAEIIFEDTDDILNSHIDIYAEPPGKKLQNLNLLSGGEKSLTAIAMLFAILMKKPSPFCVLDEIEAALDDVNVYRFASFLKKFESKSQFILITHRKGTMEIADVLYGVTMEEKGISKIVSLEIKNKAS